MQQQLNQKRSDLAVIKERINAQKASLERTDKQIETINKQLTNVDDKIKLFNSDEMMGEQAFEKLQQQIKSKENDRQSITDQLKQLKKNVLMSMKMLSHMKLHCKNVIKIYCQLKVFIKI